VTVEVRLLRDRDDLVAADGLFVAIWGPPAGLGAELLRAVEHAGGYVAGAYLDGALVGATMGFRGDHGGPSLHSHITGVLPAARGRGIARTIKLHQREWAAAQGLVAVTWTFDPLVRRNAWFNVARLGAGAAEYLVDFYGAMPDAINAGDESDRLLAVWPTGPGDPSPVPPTLDRARPVLVDRGEGPARVAAPDSDRVLVATPADIEAVRRTDPGLARAWRAAVREVLRGEMARGAVTGFTRDGDYVVDRRPS
jgi:predicted GNAT superfamily acetyltransferase